MSCLFLSPANQILIGSFRVCCMKNLNLSFQRTLNQYRVLMGCSIEQKVVAICLSTRSNSMEKHSILRNPCHPYTQGLIESIPRVSGERLKRLKTIKGFSSDRLKTEIKSEGCIFSERCKYAQDICFKQSPDAALVNSSGVHYSKCFSYYQ